MGDDDALCLRQILTTEVLAHRIHIDGVALDGQQQRGVSQQRDIDLTPFICLERVSSLVEIGRMGKFGTCLLRAAV